MNEETGQQLARLVVLSLVVVLFAMAYSFVTAYYGRRDLVDSQRAGCERAKLDRNNNAKGWRNAEDARRATGEISVANEYQSIAFSLESRSKINCHTAFPKASFIP